MPLESVDSRPIALHYFAEPKRRGPSGSISTSTHSFTCRFPAVLAPCECALHDNSPPASPVFPPCDDHFTAFPAPITIIPLLPVVSRRCPTSNRIEQSPSVCVSVCLFRSLPVSSSRRFCAALRCDDLTALGRQSYCRHLLPSFPGVARPAFPLSALRLQTFPRSKKQLRLAPRQISSKLHSYPSIALRLRLGAFLPRFSAWAHCSIPNWEPRPRKKTSLELEHFLRA